MFSISYNIIIKGLNMKKEDIVFVVGLLRKTVQERRKMTISDAQAIVNHLNMLYNTNDKKL